MYMKNIDQVYTATASKLISNMRALGETKVIAPLGFILALIKTGSLNEFYSASSEIVMQKTLVLDSSHTIRLSDVCSMDNNSIASTLDIISSIPNLDCAKLFEQILFAYSSTEGKGVDLFYQPEELTSFVAELLKVKKIQSLYNPFAGAASYQLVERDLQCYSQEINKDTWLIGKIRLFLNDVPNNFTCADSIENWLGNQQKFDAIVATPPFGLRLHNDSEASNDNLRFKHRELESWFIEKSMNSLSTDGTLVTIVPLGFLTRNNIKDFRQHLLKDHHCIQQVVELPKNLFSATGIATALLVLTRKPNDAVIMVDAKSFCRQEGRQNLLLYKELLAEMGKPSSQYIKSVSETELEENGYILNPSLYLMEPIEVPNGFELLKLGELASVHQGERAKQGKFRLIKPSDLNTDRFAAAKTFEDLDEVKIKYPANILDRDLLLVSTIGQLKVSYFHHSSNFKTACDKMGIEALELKTDIIAPEYLIGELSKDYVIKQIEARSTGSVLMRLSQKDWLEIEILVPSSIEEQKNIFEADKRQYQEDKIKELGLEIDLLKVSKYTEFERNMSLRKHALGQVLNGFMPAFTLLNTCRSKNGGTLRDDTIVAARTGETVKDYFKKLELYSLKLEKLIDVLVDQKTYGEAKPMNIDLFMKRYIAEHPTQGYKLELSYTDFDDGTDYEPMIKMSEKDLTQALDNIIANAINYGFVDTDRHDYAIHIELSMLFIEGSDKREMYAIRIANNGEALDKGMDKTKIFHWGTGRGTGLGAWQLKNIVEHYGGMVQLHEFPNDPLGFEIEYELIFPKLITN